MNRKFRADYGPWALIAGASEGLGAAFAHEVASRGVHVVLVARSEDKLQATAAQIEARHGVETRVVPLDLGAPELIEALKAETASLEIGLVVYNAAYAPIGSFLGADLERQLDIIRVNCMGPVRLAHHFGNQMTTRGRGGVLLMSSLAGFHGAAMVSAYAATKAFNRVFAEGLWDELRSGGVDVLASCAGATDTPGYRRVTPKDAVKTMRPDKVAQQSLDALRDGPTMTPGLTNRLAGLFMQRVLPRRSAVKILGKTMRNIYGDH